MTMCPYKWFLYMASIWAVLYVLLEGMMQIRDARRAQQKPGFEPVMLHDDDSDADESDEEIEDKIEPDDDFETPLSAEQAPLVR